jgi:hypothetical protein
VFSDGREICSVKRFASGRSQAAKINVVVHQVRNKLDVASEPIELRDHEQSLRRFRAIEGVAQPRPGTVPAAFDLDEFLNDAVAAVTAEGLDGSALRLDA